MVWRTGGFEIPKNIQFGLCTNRPDGGLDGMPYTTIDRDRNPYVFNVNRDDDDAWLNRNWANPSNEWDADDEIMFRYRKYFFPPRYSLGGFSLSLR